MNSTIILIAEMAVLLKHLRLTRSLDDFQDTEAKRLLKMSEAFTGEISEMDELEVE